MVRLYRYDHCTTWVGGTRADGAYSPGPSHDVLDDFLSLVRSQSSRSDGVKRQTVSPLNFRAQQGHRKQWSDGSGEKLAIRRCLLVRDRGGQRANGFGQRRLRLVGR